jgi:hypothetical protein
MGLGQQGRHIGRVGALAVALGIGGAIAALPAAAGADPSATTNPGMATSSVGTHAPRNSTKPGPSAQKSSAAGAPAPAAAKPYGALSAAGRGPLDRLGTGNDPLAPVAEPLSWTVLAASRRELSGRGTASTAATLATSSSQTGTVALPASATASGALDTAVQNFIDHYLPGWKPIAGELVPIVADGIQDLLSNGAVGAEVDRLVTNTTILQFISTKVATALTTYVGVPQGVSTVVGTAAADWVRNVFDNVGVRGALDVFAHAVMPTTEQYTEISTGLAANDLQPLGNYLSSIVTDSAGEIATFLSDPTVQSALSSATANVVIDISNGANVPAALGNIVAGWVSDGSAGSTAASAIGTAVGNAVQGLLSNSTAMQGLATVVGAAVTNILGAPNVAAAVASATTQFGTAVLGGTDWITALDTAWQGLHADSAFVAALGAAAGSAVYSLATDSGVVSALGATATALVNSVAGNPDVQAFIGTLLGPTYGPTLVSTLANPASAAQLAATVGSVVTGFLGQAGVAAALSTAANQIVTALLAGTTLTDAVQSALLSLQIDPAINAALNVTLPAGLRSALTVPAVQQALGVVAQGVVVRLIDMAPLTDTVLNPAVSQVTKATVNALLANPAAQDLISSIAGDILSGTPADQMAASMIQAVVKSPNLQVALGMALGQGIGALFGDNPVAFAIGQMAGVTAALLIGLASGAALVFNQAAGAGATSVPSSSPYLVVLRLDQLVLA